MGARDASVVTVDDCGMRASGASTARLRTKETIPWNGVTVMQCRHCFAHVGIDCIMNNRAELLAGFSGKGRNINLL